MQLIVLLGSMQALILFLLLVTRRNNRLSNRLLGIIMLVVFLHLLIVANDNPAFFQKYPHVSRISWVLSALYGPLIYMYVRMLIPGPARLRFRDLWPLGPVLLLIALKMPFFIQSATEKRAYMAQWDLVLEHDYGWFNQLVNIVDLFFMFAALVWYYRYLKGLKDEFSDIERRRLDWLRHFLYASTGVMLFATLLFNARSYHIPFLEPLHGTHFIAMVLLMYWIGYRALSQPDLFNMAVAGKEIPREKAELAPEEEETPQDTRNMEEQALRLQQIVAERRLYLRNELTLAELSAESGYSRHQLSEIINTCFGRNFYDYINDFRLEEFKRLATLPEYAHLNILGLAMESGFNSKATFNNFFRKRTGQTPSEYVKLLKDSR